MAALRPHLSTSGSTRPQAAIVGGPYHRHRATSAIVDGSTTIVGSGNLANIQAMQLTPSQRSTAAAQLIHSWRPRRLYKVRTCDDDTTKTATGTHDDTMTYKDREEIKEHHKHTGLLPPQTTLPYSPADRNPPHTFQVWVQVDSGRTKATTVSPQWTTQRLKETLQHTTQTHPSHLVLSTGRGYLRDNRTLHEQGIAEHSLIHLGASLLGGMPPTANPSKKKSSLRPYHDSHRPRRQPTPRTPRDDASMAPPGLDNIPPYHKHDQATPPYPPPHSHNNPQSSSTGSPSTAHHTLPHTQWTTEHQKWHREQMTTYYKNTHQQPPQTTIDQTQNPFESLTTLDRYLKLSGIDLQQTHPAQQLGIPWQDGPIPTKLMLVQRLHFYKTIHEEATARGTSAGKDHILQEWQSKVHQAYDTLCHHLQHQRAKRMKEDTTNIGHRELETPFRLALHNKYPHHYHALHTSEQGSERITPELALTLVTEIQNTFRQDTTTPIYPDIFYCDHPTLLWLPDFKGDHKTFIQHITHLLDDSPHATVTCLATKDIQNPMQEMLTAYDFLDEWKPFWWKTPPSDTPDTHPDIPPHPLHPPQTTPTTMARLHQNWFPPHLLQNRHPVDISPYTRHHSTLVLATHT